MATTLAVKNAVIGNPSRKEAYARLGAVERLTPEEQAAHAHEAIGSRPVRTLKNEKEIKANPDIDPIAKTRWVVQGFLERFFDFFR